jgi:plastocyanin
MRRFALLSAILVASCPAIPALELTGKITLDRNMVKKSLTPAVYDLRGAAVPDRPAHRRDPGAFGRVAVWLEGENTNHSQPVAASMDQRGRRFEPDLLIVPAGSKISFPNLDPIFHNIFSLSRTRDFDLGYYPQGKSREVIFPKTGIVQVYCHIHPEMYGIIVVTSSKWTAQPGPDGSFSWSDIPAGKYRLMIWQRSAGLQHRSVEIPQSGRVQVEVRLPEENEGTDR